jgi:hypothetical protein
MDGVSVPDALYLLKLQNREFTCDTASRKKVKKQKKVIIEKQHQGV